MKTLTRILKNYPLSLLTVLTIVLLSLLPFPEIKMAEDVPLADKWVHMVMYGGLSLMVWIEYLRNGLGFRKDTAILLTLIAPILLGGLMELAQAYLTETRSGDWMDWFADAIGSFICLFIGFGLLKPWLQKKRAHI